MSSQGPKVQITSSEIEKFQSIIKAPAEDKKVLMLNLEASEKLKFALYVKMLQSKEKLRRTGAELDELDAREAALRAQDKTYLTQASTSYAPKVGEVQTSVPKEPATGSAPRYGSKFSQ